MKTVRINPQGGSVSAEVRCGFAQPGSYVLRLWAANENRILLREEGNFINSQDDTYVLPETARDNHGRIVQALVAVAITPPETRYQSDLVIRQDGAEVGRESLSGTSSEPSVALNIFLTLSAGE